MSRGLFPLTLRIFGLRAIIHHYLRRMGGRLLHLTRALLPLAEFLRARQILLLADYLPGIWNVLADPLSRQEACVGDAHLLPAAFQLLEKQWGPHSVDLMASAVNHQLPTYISALPDAGALTVNLFTWSPPTQRAACTAFPRCLGWAACYAGPTSTSAT